MTKIIASLVLAASVLASVGVAQAAPGEGQRAVARLGLITVGGVFDGR